MEGRPGHFRHVLPADRKGDLDPVIDLPPGLLRQPRRRVGDSPLDRLGRHLTTLRCAPCNCAPTKWEAFNAASRRPRRPSRPGDEQPGPDRRCPRRRHRAWPDRPSGPAPPRRRTFARHDVKNHDLLSSLVRLTTWRCPLSSRKNRCGSSPCSKPAPPLAISDDPASRRISLRSPTSRPANSGHAAIIAGSNSTISLLAWSPVILPHNMPYE